MSNFQRIINRFQNALGYVVPQTACQRLRVNEKCDIYGSGVLILQLLIDRKPVEYGVDNGVILSDHARDFPEEGNVLECVDHSIGDYPEDEVLLTGSGMYFADAFKQAFLG